MATVYDWNPLFESINNATNQWAQRNQYNSMIDALGGKPTYKADAPPMPGDSEGQTSAATPTTSGALAGINPVMLQAIRSAPPSVGLPLLLQLATKENKYSQTPQYDQNGNAFVLDEQGNMKTLPGVKAREKVEFVNGQATNPYDTKPGTVIPKQEADPEIVRTAIRLYPNDQAAQRAYVIGNSPASVARLRASNGGDPKPGDPINIPHPGSMY